MLDSLKAETKNGNTIRGLQVAAIKQIHKLEKLFVVTRNKLSCARTENALLKTKIDDMRKDKALMIRIFLETETDLSNTQRENDEAAALINELHERKHRTQMEMQNIKEQMVKSMETFSRELDTVKETIEYNQNSLLEGIRERLLFQSTARSQRFSPSKTMNTKVTFDQTKEINSNPLEDEIKSILSETGVESPEELRMILEQDENFTFSVYREVQDQTEEVEKLETDVKHLEEDLSALNSKIEELEQSNLFVHKDLDSHIMSIQKQVIIIISSQNSLYVSAKILPQSSLYLLHALYFSSLPQ